MLRTEARVVEAPPFREESDETVSAPVEVSEVPVKAPAVAVES